MIISKEDMFQGLGRCLRVNVVDANEVVLDQDFALLRLRDGGVGPVLEHLRSAGLLDYHSLHRLGDGC
jgi:hypothetical protein